MKTGWYGPAKAQTRYLPDAETLSTQDDWTGERCVVMLDATNEQAYDWLERQLRMEAIPKTWLVLSLLPLSALIAQRSWIEHFKDHFLSLPPDDPEQPSQMLEQLNPLSDSALQQLRQALFSDSWSQLAHDAAKDLLHWPERKARLIDRLRNFSAQLPFGYATKLQSVKQLLVHLEDWDPETIQRQIADLGAEVSIDQMQLPKTLNPATDRHRLNSVLRHWLALPEKIAQFSAGLEKLGLSASLPGLLASLKPELTGQELSSLAGILQKLAESPDYAGSALSRLSHNTLEQHVFHVLDELQILGFPLEGLTPDVLAQKLDLLGPEPLPETLPVQRRRDKTRGPLHVLVVENEPSWQASILDALGVICRSHGWGEQQVVFGPLLCAANRQQAQDLIKKHRRSPLIVITDLSIPETAQDEAFPEVGEALLKHLLSVGQNLPLLLLTTPQHALPEQRRLTQLGFNQVDFVLKLRLDQLYERLEEWLEQQLEARFCHHIELHEGLFTVRIDGTSIELGKVSFALLMALARAHQRGSRALSQSELIETDEDLRFALQEQHDPAGFSKSLYQLKKELLNGMAEAERFLLMSELIADSRDSVGNKTFRIWPQNQVKIRTGFEQEHEDVLNPENPPEPLEWLQPRLLIVEDEPLWSLEIEELATQMGFICRRVGTIADAYQALSEFKPDVLTLDLQLPEHDGAEGRDTGGFEVLQRARELNPAIRTVIPSSHFRRSVLVSQAARLGVPLVDFVPKGASLQGVSWLIHLYNRLRHHRLELHARQDQADTHALLPPLNLVLTEAENEGSVTLQVNGHLWSGATLEARLLEQLATKAGQWQIYDELYEAIYPDTEPGFEVRHEEFEQVLKRARRVITQQWLQRQVSDKIGTLILERQGQRFCLHANIVSPQS